MIELFDPSRLQPRRDHSLLLASLVLAAGAGCLAVYAGSVQHKLRAEQARKTTLEGELRQAQARKLPSQALLGDLQRQVQLAELETHAAADTTAGQATASTPSAWLDRLAALGSPDVSLTRIDVDRAGGTHIEGLATSAQAVSAFVQAFSRHEELAGMKPRSVELRQDKDNAQRLRFQLRAAANAAPPGAPR